MLYEQLTHYEKMRFKNNIKCKICGQVIHQNESFQMCKTHIGRSVHYSFFHTLCLIDENEIMMRKKYNPRDLYPTNVIIKSPSQLEDSGMRGGYTYAT